MAPGLTPGGPKNQNRRAVPKWPPCNVFRVSCKVRPSQSSKRGHSGPKTWPATWQPIPLWPKLWRRFVCLCVLFYSPVASHPLLCEGVAIAFHGFHCVPWIPWMAYSWTPSYSMEFMAYNGIHEIQWNPWNTMDSLEHHGLHRTLIMKSMEYHGIHGVPWSPWNTMESMEYNGIHGIPWTPSNTMASMENQWNPWKIMEFMEYNGIHGITWIPWNTMDSMDI